MQQEQQQQQEKRFQPQQQRRRQRQQRPSSVITRHRHDNIISQLLLFIICLVALLPTSLHCHSLSTTPLSPRQQRRRRQRYLRSHFSRSYTTSPINNKNFQSEPTTITTSNISSKQLFKSSTTTTTTTTTTTLSSSNDDEPPSSPASSNAAKIVLILAIAAVSLTLLLVSCYPCLHQRSMGHDFDSKKTSVPVENRLTIGDIAEGGGDDDVDHNMEFDWVTNPDVVRGTEDPQRPSIVDMFHKVIHQKRKSSVGSTTMPPTRRGSEATGSTNNTKKSGSTTNAKKKKQRRRPSSGASDVSSSWKQRLSESFRHGNGFKGKDDGLTSAAAAATAQDSVDDDIFEVSPSNFARPSLQGSQNSNDEPVIQLYKKSMPRYPSDQTFKWSGGTGSGGSGNMRSSGGSGSEGSGRKGSVGSGYPYFRDEKFEAELRKIYSNQSLHFSDGGTTDEVTPRISNGDVEAAIIKESLRSTITTTPSTTTGKQKRVFFASRK